MPDPVPIDPLEGPRYALEGRVVTMDADSTVLRRGVVYVDGGHIVAVADADAPRPDGFAGESLVRTGGTIFPGLIELHNHLSYNILPLWQVPDTFVNRDQWAGRDDYRLAVTGPMSVLGRTPGYVQAIVRYVEAKCLLAGTTTSQGITLSSNAGIRKHYRGVVRNVEQSGDADLPNAATHVADVAEGTAEAFLGQLEKTSTLLLHLSEGIGPTARRHFEALRIKPREWAITPALAGIHCAGLNADNFHRLARNGGTMVWSPLSNLLLYGKTANLKAARAAGVLIALGSDWSPSGSKNLLGELKAAALFNEGLPADARFSARELVETVTMNPARILKWDHAIGSIEAGKRADLLVLDNMIGDPYDQLIEGRETSITLVVINGVPRYGARALMERFGPETERISVGGSDRSLFLTQPTGDAVVGEITLADARRTLQDGLDRLPELALALEQRGLPRGDELVLELDQNREDEVFDPLARGLPPLSQVLTPLTLDPLLVVDDNGFLPSLATQRNLPKAMRSELPARYGG
jgi:cytosine/adenosine deaminase-related metal-dependent hydrolase